MGPAAPLFGPAIAYNLSLRAIKTFVPVPKPFYGVIDAREPRPGSYSEVARLWDRACIQQQRPFVSTEHCARTVHFSFWTCLHLWSKQQRLLEPSFLYTDREAFWECPVASLFKKVFKSSLRKFFGLYSIKNTSVKTSFHFQTISSV